MLDSTDRYIARNDASFRAVADLLVRKKARARWLRRTRLASTSGTAQG